MPKLKEIIGETAYNALPEDTRKQHGEIDFVDGANHVDKKDLETANATIKQQVKDIKKRDDDIVAISGKVKDNEELTNEIETLTKANKADSEKYAADLAKINFDARLEKKLGDYKPKNLGILMNQIDSTKLTLDGENFIGLEDQITKLKETADYLFEVETKGGAGNLGGGAGSSSLIDDNTDQSQLSLGARLAAQRTEATKVIESQNTFFK